MGELSKLPGLGPKSELLLNRIGLKTKEDLVKLGAIPAFLKLQEASGQAPSLNFLYALVGAIEGRDWRSVATTERTRLIMELDGLDQLEGIVHGSNSPET